MTAIEARDRQIAHTYAALRKLTARRVVSAESMLDLVTWAMRNEIKPTAHTRVYRNLTERLVDATPSEPR